MSESHFIHVPFKALIPNVTEDLDGRGQRDHHLLHYTYSVSMNAAPNQQSIVYYLKHCPHILGKESEQASNFSAFLEFAFCPLR